MVVAGCRAGAWSVAGVEFCVAVGARHAGTILALVGGEAGVVGAGAGREPVWGVDVCTVVDGINAWAEGVVVDGAEVCTVDGARQGGTTPALVGGDGDAVDGGYEGATGTGVGGAKSVGC